GRTSDGWSLRWAERLPFGASDRVDAVLGRQGITGARRRQLDFARPYAVFHESVLVRRGDPVKSAGDLAGRRVAAIAGSTNMALAETFDGAETVPFGGDSDDVFGDMLAALRSGEGAAVGAGDVVLV